MPSPPAWGDASPRARPRARTRAGPRATGRTSGRFRGRPRAPPGAVLQGARGVDPGPRETQLLFPDAPHGLLAVLGGEPVDEQDPVHVVRLVLQDAGEELLRVEDDRGPVELDRGDPNAQRALHREVHPGDGQTALLGLLLALEIVQLGVGELAGAGAVVEDDQPQRHTDLWTGQA